MSSIYTGVSGMQANQYAIDVIANNIANLNTIGFKASRVSFQEALTQTMAGSGSIGTSPMQIGMGVATGSINIAMTQGNLRQTGDTRDLAMVGDGFFVVGDDTSQQYTRDGVFQLDAHNRLVMASNGLSVRGWQADRYTGELNTTASAPGEITIPIGSLYAVPTSNAKLGGNLDASAAVGGKMSLSFDIYDSLGTSHAVTVEFTKTAAGTWSWAATSPDAATGSTPGTGTLTFDEHGRLASGTGALSLDLTNANGATSPIDFTIDFSAISQLDGTGSVQAMGQDGLPMGIMQNFAIGEDGVIYGSFSNGASRVVGQLAVARFANPAGLSNTGNNLWNVSLNSGPSLVQPASASGSKVRSGFVEMSNVDLSTEFANMIVTQRAFQANSRSITSADEMMQEVLQLKR